jgi:Holliday junction DNA helicase RuvA
MIAQLTGTVAGLSGSAMVITVSGVGFEVHATARTIRRVSIGETVSLHTRLVVREDALQLFGFDETPDRESFDLLCSISGVGPKLALSILSQLDTQTLAAAVSSQNEALLRSISGVGPKTAKLILLSLSGKLSPATDSRLITALVGLGTAPDVAARVAAEVDAGLDDSQALKAALAILGSGKLS